MLDCLVVKLTFLCLSSRSLFSPPTIHEIVLHKQFDSPRYTSLSSLSGKIKTVSRVFPKVFLNSVNLLHLVGFESGDFRKMLVESSPTVDEGVDGAVYQSETGGETAVYVRNACKSFGVGKRRSTVLRNLDMNVKKGTM